jgi:two-component system, chemotaxis family, sensor kinase CheA
MDVGRFLDLYVSETQDHVRLLQRSLLRLDADRDGHALTEAFRAVHTLKGMSAAMGHGRVAALAHELEDRLDELRGRTPASAEDVDAMLLRADELERAIAAAIDGNSVLDESDLLRPARSARHAAPTGPAERPIEADLPAVDAHVARVVLCEDAPLKAARALLIVRALDGMPGVLGTYPDHFDTDFAGTLDIYLDDTFDAAAIEVAVTAVGDVDRVRFIDRAGTPRAGAGAAHQTARLPQLRVNSERLDGLADGIGELSVLFGRLARDGAEPVLAGSLAATVDRMAVVIHELQHDVLELRMVRVREAFERLPRVSCAMHHAPWARKSTLCSRVMTSKWTAPSSRRSASRWCTCCATRWITVSNRRRSVRR